MTSHQASMRRKLKAEEKSKWNNAVKKATICYENELQKRENAEQNGCLYKIKSAKTIANKIQAMDEFSIDEKTIRNHVRNGNTGRTPIKPGRKGSIYPQAYKALCAALETYIMLWMATQRLIVPP